MSEHRRTFTTAEKKELVARISADIAHGMLSQDACKKHSVGKTQYAAWKEGKAMQVERHPKGGTTTTIDVSTLPKKRNGPLVRKKHATMEERMAIVARVRALLTTGMNLKAACRTARITDNTYYKWIKNLSPDRLPALNGHKAVKGAPEIRVMLQVAGITFQGEPLNLSLDDAVKLQQGLTTLLRAHHG